MADVQQLSDCKRKITLAMKRVNKGIAENNEALVKQYVSELKAAYQTFEQEHEVQCLTREADGMQMGDEYLVQVMDGYTNCLSETNTWLKEQSQPVLKHEQLGKILTLPKIDLEPYDGDPMKYNSFRAIFNRSIDSVVCSDDDKLVYLLRCTCGPAKDAINMCALMEGRDGYQKAWDILERRFGNVYLVANIIKGNLCSDKPVKSALDLRNLADETENASIILKRSTLYAELDTQHMISDVCQVVT